MHHPNIVIPPPLIFACAFIIAVLLDYYVMPVHLAKQMSWIVFLFYVGWLITVLGTLLSIWALLIFRKARTAIMPNKPADALVQTGPYRYTRNPMYVSLFLVYSGLSLIYNNVYAVAFVPVLFGIFNRIIIPREENYLKQRFPAAYSAYSAIARRWL